MDEELEFDVQMASMVQLMREGGIVRYDDAMRIFRRHFLLHALKEHGNNVSRAAKAVGIHRNLIHRHAVPLELPRNGRGRRAKNCNSDCE